MEKSSFESEELLPQPRSTFLTVLCVLTFAGSVLGIFRGVTAFNSASKVVAETQKSMNQKDQQEQRKKLTENNDRGSKFALKMMDSVGQINEKNIKLSSAASVIANVLTLIGAILMWRLNRAGFYVYVAGVLLDVVAPFVIYGTGSFLAVMSSVFTGFIGLIFIVLYAFNLKDMKPFKPAVT